MTAQLVRLPAVPLGERHRVDRTEEWYLGSFDPYQVYILPQHRRSYDDDWQPLADSLATGQLQDAGIAELNYEQAVEYLAVFAKLFKVKLSIDDYPISLDKRYRFDIWGNRRNMGMRWLKDHGCSECQEEFGRTAPKRCGAKHARNGIWELDCKVYPGIHPIKALGYQLAENSYSPPSRENIAEMMQEHWDISRAVDPKLTKKAYAAKCGFSVGYVSDSLRFCEMPETVKKMVRSGFIKWGSALQLNKMVEAGLPEDRVVRVAQLIIAGNLRVTDVAKRVKYELNCDQDIHQGMFADMDDDPVVSHRAAVKSLLTRGALTALRIEVGLLQEAHRAIKIGVLEATVVASNPEILTLLARGDELRQALMSL